MLCYSPEIWTSDDTDPIERLDIQGGMYYLYPPSTVSAHVSMSPHQQTLRQTPLSTRFNVSAFGVLGYELDLDELTPAELREIKSQIEFYKKHRRTLQYGELKIVKCEKPNQISWQITSGKETVIGLFQTHAHACDPRDSLRMADPTPDARYLVESVGAGLDIRRFGSLIKHVVPISLSTDGFILRTVARHYQMTDGSERYECSGRALASGIGLAMQYAGTGYHRDLRILGDFGSSLYLITEKENENKGEDQ